MPDLRHPVRPIDLVAQWRVDWLSVAVLAVLVVLVVRDRRRLHPAGRPWPVSRDVVFGTGIVLALWVTCGFPQARGPQLMWVWTMQALLLLLVVPTVLLAAQPVPVLRVLRARVLRGVAHPALSPLYVPIAAGLLFFGGVGELGLRSEHAGWVLHVLLLALGAVIARPLVDREDTRTSLAVGAALAIGVVELLVDAVPGLVLRLETHLTIPWFGLDRPSWSPGWLADQQAAGSILWTVAEVLDLPFLVLTVLQWIRVERTEAGRIDAELDRRELTAPEAERAAAPWWHDDPTLRARYGPPGQG